MGGIIQSCLPNHLRLTILILVVKYNKIADSNKLKEALYVLKAKDDHPITMMRTYTYKKKQNNME